MHRKRGTRVAQRAGTKALALVGEIEPSTIALPCTSTFRLLTEQTGPRKTRVETPPKNNGTHAESSTAAATKSNNHNMALRMIIYIYCTSMMPA